MNAMLAMMSGSGSSVFGVFDDPADAAALTRSTGFHDPGDAHERSRRAGGACRLTSCCAPRASVDIAMGTASPSLKPVSLKK